MADTPVQCAVTDCKSGPCRSVTRATLAEAAEVPLGCPNRVELSDSETQLPRWLARPDLRITPRAAALLAVCPAGTGGTELYAGVLSRRFALLEARVHHPVRARGTVAQDREPVEPVVPPPAETEKAWIKFKVVDDETGEPVPDVKLEIRLPNGRAFEYTTRPDGMIEIDEIDPGTCDILRMTDDLALEVVRVE